MQEDGVPLFITILAAAAVIGVFIIVAVILGILLLPA